MVNVLKATETLAESQVAIVGLGMMGGSLALALRGRCGRLLGCDRDQETLKLARERGVVDLALPDLEAILPHADVIILATPVCTILDLLRRIPAIHAGPAVVMDLGSTKSEILRAMSELPPAFDPIGGHPMCGRETPGLEQASADLYRGAPFALLPLSRTTVRARSIAETLVRAVNAKPLWMDPETHDTWVAATSHLPYLLAIALVSATPPEVSPLVGPGFQSATRMAVSSPEMMADIFVTNRTLVLEAVNRFAVQMERIEAMIQEGDAKSLKERFEASIQQHDRLTSNRERP